MKLIVIDVQKGIVEERLYNFTNFLLNNQKIIAAARENNIEVIYVQHDDGPGSGFTYGDDFFEISEFFAPKENEKIFVKIISTAFGNKDFADYLESEGDDTLIIIGLVTNYCIDATIKSAYERGYNIIVPAGTNSTCDNRFMNKETTYKYYNELMWPDKYARVISVEETIKLMEQENRDSNKQE